MLKSGLIRNHGCMWTWLKGGWFNYMHSVMIGCLGKIKKAALIADASPYCKVCRWVLEERLRVWAQLRTVIKSSLHGIMVMMCFIRIYLVKDEGLRGN